ncbi:hypothetical protein HDV06_001268 [Boothiomyces sp. JEL0866]|nr:hypothetical protein HDV06_001268 [Boothiomyces sp. JEL0866]
MIVVNTEYNGVNFIQAQWDISIIIISLWTSILGCHTALRIIEDLLKVYRKIVAYNIYELNKRKKKVTLNKYLVYMYINRQSIIVLLLSGCTIGGCSVWSLHYIGIFALELVFYTPMLPNQTPKGDQTTLTYNNTQYVGTGLYLVQSSGTIGTLFLVIVGLTLGVFISSFGAGLIHSSMDTKGLPNVSMYASFIRAASRSPPKSILKVNKEKSEDSLQTSSSADSGSFSTPTYTVPINDDGKQSKAVIKPVLNLGNTNNDTKIDIGIVGRDFSELSADSEPTSSVLAEPPVIDSEASSLADRDLKLPDMHITSLSKVDEEYILNAVTLKINEMESSSYSNPTFLTAADNIPKDYDPFAPLPESLPTIPTHLSYTARENSITGSVPSSIILQSGVIPDSSPSNPVPTQKQLEPPKVTSRRPSLLKLPGKKKKAKGKKGDKIEEEKKEPRKLSVKLTITDDTSPTKTRVVSPQDEVAEDPTKEKREIIESNFPPVISPEPEEEQESELATSLDLNYIEFLDLTVQRKVIFCIGALLFGISICAMHYLGVVAVNIPYANTKSNYVVIIISVGVALVVSLIALWIIFFLKIQKLRFFAPILMALGIGGMHFISLYGFIVIPNVEQQVDLDIGMPNEATNYLISAMSVIHLGFTFQLFAFALSRKILDLKKYNIKR